MYGGEEGEQRVWSQDIDLAVEGKVCESLRGSQIHTFQEVLSWQIRTVTSFDYSLCALSTFTGVSLRDLKKKILKCCGRVKQNGTRNKH